MTVTRDMRLISRSYPYDLWTSVVRRPAGRLQHAPAGLQRGHAEVRHLDVVLVIQQKVLGLQVAVTATEDS